MDDHNTSGSYSSGRNKAQRIQKQHNQRRVYTPPDVHFDASDLRKSYLKKKAFKIRGHFILIDVPYDPEIRRVLNALELSKYLPDKRCWEVHIVHHPDIVPMIDRIEGLHEAAFQDRVLSTAREAAGDKRYWISGDLIDDYVVGYLAFFGGHEVVITHITRPFWYDGGVKHAVYTKPYKGEAIDMPADDGFS